MSLNQMTTDHSQQKRKKKKKKKKDDGLWSVYSNSINLRPKINKLRVVG